jgi:NAD(P)-dependent dehydrogenase (short-subunit alcohol dehydrogenase family)
VILTDIDPAVRQVAATIGSQASVWLTDLQDPQAIFDLFQTIRATYGRLDGLVNNAAWQQESGGVLDEPLAEWEQVINVCLRAAFLTIKQALPLMMAQGGGSIVNLSSIHAIRAYRGHPAYDVAKAGLSALTRQVALEYGPHGVRVNAILPGLIEDVRHPVSPARARAYPVRRLGQPSDVAAMVAFLLSDDAAFVSGADISVDGGLSAYSPEELLTP